jgi:hypothetical protein
MDASGDKNSPRQLQGYALNQQKTTALTNHRRSA